MKRQKADLSKQDLEAAAKVAGIEFTEMEREQMLREVQRRLRSFAAFRKRKLDNSVAPALSFSPLLPGMKPRIAEYPKKEYPLPDRKRPEDLSKIAFWSIPELASLVRSKQISCVELLEFFLGRLERADKTLHCVITFTKERALRQAKALDAELAEGKWRGLLHGIPYGAKDLFAVKGYRCTWGAKPYEQQQIEVDASVIQKLDQAGAVLVAKTTLGALAMGDVWFGGRTRSPWNPERGSSGSSAGSAAASAAGALPFALGTETLGSIVSPSFVCGCSSLRPSFGRVSRAGAMALSWSMDKVGPLCRSATDAAIVFAAIQGPDGKDGTVIKQPFQVPVDISVKGMRVGYAKGQFARNRRILDELKALGVELVEIELPKYPSRDMTMILRVEGAAAFDELTRSGRDDLLVRQDAQAWPTTFRAARLIPAVEFLQANRLRTLLMQDMDKAMKSCDVLVHPPYTALADFNLTGHPSFVAPYGSGRGGRRGSICFTGQLFDESRLLALVMAWQKTTKWHLAHPKLLDEKTSNGKD